MAEKAMRYGPLARVVSQTKDDEPEEKRPDGRAAWDLQRSVYLRGSTLSNAAGSAYMDVGGTKVFCSVHGPRPSPSSQSIDAVIQCEIRWANFASLTPVERRVDMATDKERELSAALSRTLSAVVRLSMYPKSRIQVSAFVVEDDGGAFASIITACCLALADAGIELIDLTAGGTAAVVGDRVVLDPCAEEERMARGTVLVGYMANSGLITEVMQTGEIDVEEFEEAVKMCCGGAKQVCGLMRTCVLKSVRKMLVKQQREGK